NQAALQLGRRQDMVLPGLRKEAIKHLELRKAQGICKESGTARGLQTHHESLASTAGGALGKRASLAAFQCRDGTRSRPWHRSLLHRIVFAAEQRRYQRYCPRNRRQQLYPSVWRRQGGTIRSVACSCRKRAHHYRWESGNRREHSPRRLRLHNLYANLSVSL